MCLGNGSDKNHGDGMSQLRATSSTSPEGVSQAAPEHITEHISYVPGTTNEELDITSH